jgi:hypothetical protein
MGVYSMPQLTYLKPCTECENVLFFKSLTPHRCSVCGTVVDFPWHLVRYKKIFKKTEQLDLFNPP